MTVDGLLDAMSIVKVIDQELPAWVRIVDAAHAPVAATVKPGSSLAADDDATRGYNLSHAAWRGFSIAVDNLDALRSLIADANVLHIYAPFSMLRVAIENASKAVWLLQPADRKTRVERRLRIAASDMKNIHALVGAVDGATARTLAERQEDLRSLANSAGITHDVVKGRVGYEQIVAEAGAGSAAGERLSCVTWKVSSAMQHGDMEVAILLLDKNNIQQQGSTMGAQMSAPVELLTYMSAIVVTMTREALRLYKAAASAGP